MQARFIISDIQTNSTYFKDKFMPSYRTTQSNKNDSPVRATKPSALHRKINKTLFLYPYFLNNEARKQNGYIGRIFLLFWVCFRPKSHFSEDKRDTIEKKTAFFLKKTKSFYSKDFVLALLTLRFLEKRRRFLTVKTPSFFNRSSIYLQLVVRQLIAKPSNTRKISMRKLSTENSQAMKLKELKIVNLQCLRKG